MGAKCQGQQVLLTLTPILIQAASIMHSPFQPKPVADSQLHSAQQLHAWHTVTQGLISVSTMTTLIGTQTMADCNALSQSV